MLEYKYTQLAMRALRPEHFFTSEVVLRTWEPTQAVAKCVPYRWRIQYLIVLRGENKMEYNLFMTLLSQHLFKTYLSILALRTVVESFEILPIDCRYIKSYS